MYKQIDKNEARLHKHMRQKGHILGTASRPRVSVFRSNKNISAQLVDDEKHVTLAAASTESLHIENGANVDAAKKVGEALAKKASELKITEVVFDRSGYVYHGRVKALADALREGGLKF